MFSGLVERVRQQSRWLNAISVEATPAQIAELSALTFVSRVDVVRRPAYAASFILAVTEDVRSETPIEEDYWAAAAEWAEALGADVISSSLGYLDFDLPHTSYTARDMNGDTAVTTRAAALAAERGVVVVNSAGNQGLDPTQNTLGAPADGVRVVAVGAVTRSGARAQFSSVGSTADRRIKPDVAAMGVSVKVARHFENAYGLASGTSFSCPLTAGVIALVLQAHPDYTPDDVLTALRGSASQAGAPDTLLGWGVLDAVAQWTCRCRYPGASVLQPLAARRFKRQKLNQWLNLIRKTLRAGVSNRPLTSRPTRKSP